MVVKTLSSEQLYDSLSRVALQSSAAMSQRLADPQRQAFLIKMQTQSQTATDFELGVPQALTLLNGSELNRASTPLKAGCWRPCSSALHDRSPRIELLSWLLSRGPATRSGAGSSTMSRAPSPEKHKEAVGDVVWALVNMRRVCTESLNGNRTWERGMISMRELAATICARHSPARWARRGYGERLAAGSGRRAGR